MRDERRLLKFAVRIVLVVALGWTVLASVSCDSNVYMGVSVAGPYAGYPYGGYGGAYPYRGGVYVGRPIYR